LRKVSLFKNFENHNRLDFPKPIRRVTSGQGGEVLLVLGRQGAALVDCGMAYCWESLLNNLEKALSGSSLDYILLTHTHYDHVGALPYIRERYPRAKVLASSYGEKVLKREGARRVIGELGKEAARIYAGIEMEVRTDGMCVDQVLKEKDRVDLGDVQIEGYETPGHTSCSMSFFLRPNDILLASESTGILLEPGIVHTAILKSHKASLASGEKMRDLNPKVIVLPHYGVLPSHVNQLYWDWFFNSSREKMDFIKKMDQDGLSREEMLERYIEKYWDDNREQEQPKEAFLVNARSIITVLLEE